jgi:antitoxin FitA
MAQLTVRNVDGAVVAALKARAQKAGRSAEPEHRKILEEVLCVRERRDSFDHAEGRRVRLRSGGTSTTALLRADRDRDGA